MDIKKEEIYKTVCEIINDSSSMTFAELEVKYKDFKDNFFKLFQICVDVTPETKNKLLSELSILLNIREDVKSGKKESIEANVQVSEYMAKQFVYPITGEPTIEQKKIALQKIIKGEKDKKNKK